MADPYLAHICPRCGRRLVVTVKGYLATKGPALCRGGRPHANPNHSPELPNADTASKAGAS